MSRDPFFRAASPTGWWLTQPRYVRYMAREVSCIFIGAYTGLIVVGLLRLADGADAWNGFIQALQTPQGLIFHLAALAFALYHTTTWFNVTPKAMPVQLGEFQLPGGVIIAAHYGGWALLSALVLYLAGV